MTEPTTVELFLAIAEDSTWDTGGSAEDAVENFNNNQGTTPPLRVVQINVTLSLPVIAEVSVTVPDDAGQTVTAQVPA